MPGLFIHADTVVPDFEDNVSGRGLGKEFCVHGERACGDGDAAPLGHGIHGVQEEIGQGFPQLAFVAVEIGQHFLQLRFDPDDDALALGHVLPARAGQFHHLFDESVELHQIQLLALLPAAIEFAHALHDVGDVFGGGLDVHQIPAAALAELRFFSQEQLGKGQHR